MSGFSRSIHCSTIAERPSTEKEEAKCQARIPEHRLSCPVTSYSENFDRITVNPRHNCPRRLLAHSVSPWMLSTMTAALAKTTAVPAQNGGVAVPLLGLPPHGPFANTKRVLS